MAAISSSDTIVAVSPRSSSENLNSPRNRKNNKNLSSPWANIVRGESESVSAASASSPLSSSSVAATVIVSREQISDSVVSSSPSPEISIVEALPPGISDGGNSNAAAAKSKKPAWNKPSNGAAVEVSPVMGAVSWPALSDSAKASPKSSSESLKTLSDGSNSASQVPVIASSQKQANTNANPNLTTNHQFPRQKSFKRGSGSANGGSSQPQSHPSSPTTVVEPQNNSTKNMPVVHGTSPRDPPHKSNNWESGQRTGTMSQPHIGNEHQQRNSFRRGGGGGGGHHRSDGSNHYNHGNRRDPDRANHDLNPPHRVFNGRDGHMQQRVNQRNFVRPMQPSTAPFVSPPPGRPFGNPLGFPDMASPVYYVPAPPHDSLRGVPFFHAAPFTMILPGPGPGPGPVRTVLTKQIEYYFSPENLCKDIYLRTYMDVQGWVLLSVIATFNRVKQLANNNIPLIVESVRNSTIVEVQDDKIRKRNDWMNWTLLSGQSTSASDPLSPGTNHDMLANRIQSIGLAEGSNANSNGKNSADAQSQAVTSNSSSENWNDQTKASNGEGQNILQ